MPCITSMTIFSECSRTHGGQLVHRNNGFDFQADLFHRILGTGSDCIGIDIMFVNGKRNVITFDPPAAAARPETGRDLLSFSWI